LWQAKQKRLTNPTGKKRCPINENEGKGWILSKTEKSRALMQSETKYEYLEWKKNKENKTLKSAN